MKEFLDKLTSYNLFNYLLPGVLFVVFAGGAVETYLSRQSLLVDAFVYYFIGMVISRFGSLVIEPVLKRFKFVHFAEYRDFVEASGRDPKIEVLSEANNSYRTITALFVVLVLFKLYEQLGRKVPWVSVFSVVLLSLLLFVMFLFAYKKQTSYITKRIEANLRPRRREGENK